MSNSFKREFKVTTQSLMGKADVKKLRTQLMDEFPGLTKKIMDKIVSGKEEVNVLKCSNGTTLYVQANDPPAFFDDGFGFVFPTLFTLWRFPTIMPELVTYGPVSKRLLPSDRAAGADLMLPGVILPDEGLGDFPVGQKRCIRVQDNPMPIAVGKMLVSSDEVKKNGLKGKGMAVLHVYRDSLWTYGGRKTPNEGFLADEVTAAEGSTMAAEVAQAADEAEEEEAEDDDAEEDAQAGEPEEEMTPDALLEYCFFAALKTSCTDSELPISADKFYSHHMQPARPAKQPPLDAKKSSYKQIGKFIKQMHKSKYVNVRDVKNNITILSVDRTAPAYVDFELRGGSSKGEQKAAAGASADSASKEGEEVVAIRTKPPVVTELYQPNSYTKPLFEAMGCQKDQYYTLEEAHKVLERYVYEKLGASPVATGSEDASAPTGEAADGSVRKWLLSLGLTADEAETAAASLAKEGFDSLAAIRAGELTAVDWEAHEVPPKHVKIARASVSSDVASFLLEAGLSSDDAASCAEALAADGFDSVRAIRAAELKAADFEAAGVPAEGIASVCDALTPKPVTKAATPTNIDPEAVPIDELLLNSLIKFAGGQKKGATFPSHLPLSELKAKMIERLTAFFKVSVEGEAPLIKKGVIKPIQIEMKRAAGHNKTHVSGLESFIISPEAVAQSLKLKLGCTTAVLKLPGNNVKEKEVLLQGHCVQEVVDYLRDVYCIDKRWIDMKLKK